MNDTSIVKEHLEMLLSSQNLAVLATNNGDRPHTSIVAFTITDDFRTILFATTRSTRKFRNLMSNPHVAMLIDNRSNEEKDFHAAVAATAYGVAEELPEAGEGSDEYHSLYLAKHPYLVDFLRSPTCALVGIKVEKYSLVSRFQNVIEWEVGP